MIRAAHYYLYESCSPLSLREGKPQRGAERGWAYHKGIRFPMGARMPGLEIQRSIALIEQRLDILFGQRFKETGFSGDQAFNQGAFMFLQL